MKLTDKFIRILLWGPLITIFLLVPFIPNNTFVFYIMFIVTIFHSYLTKGLRFTIFFSVFVFLLSWVAEFFGVTQGIPFGKYYYLPGSELGPLMFGVVPIAIPITWTVINYIGIEILEIITHYQVNLLKILNTISGRIAKKLKYIGYTFILSFLDGFIITVWDISMDPIAVKLGYYVWESQGSGLYFVIPITNFFGWWSLGVIISLCYFLIFEPIFIRPYKRKNEIYLTEITRKIPFTLQWIPFVCYVILFLGIFKIIFTTTHEFLYGFTNIFVMGPIVLIVIINLLFPNGVFPTKKDDKNCQK